MFRAEQYGVWTTLNTLMNRKPFSKAVIGLGGLIAVSIFILVRLQDFDFSERPTYTIRFNHLSDQLEGTLLLPSENPSPPVVLIVHGDGAQNRWSDDGYAPLVNDLLDQGIAVFSWDKPGVGASQGNWLAQVMDDRAAEAAAALKRLRSEPALTDSPMGFLGFSQAGWVVPQASKWGHADFAVLVGPAINWRGQGLYYRRQRLMAQQVPPSDLDKAERSEAALFDTRFTPEQAAGPCDISCTRQDFERRNSQADAQHAIANMHTPVMILMGEADRNVSPDESLAVWSERLPKQTHRCIRKIPSATHGLLRSTWFDYQLTSQWPWYSKAIFLMYGRDAYAPDALSSIASWVLDRKCG